MSVKLGLIIVVQLLVIKSVNAERRNSNRWEEYEEYGAGMPYSFAYTVRDDETYNNYGHKEDSNGKRTEGEYFVNLPDGRTQVVTYYVDADSGFVADVKYVDGPYKPSTYTSKTTAYSQSEPSIPQKQNNYYNEDDYDNRQVEPSYYQQKTPSRGNLVNSFISTEKVGTLSLRPSSSPVRPVSAYTSPKTSSRLYSAKNTQLLVTPRPRMDQQKGIYINRKPSIEESAFRDQQILSYANGATTSRQYVKVNKNPKVSSVYKPKVKYASIAQLPLRRPIEAEPVDLSVKEALAKYQIKKFDTIFRDEANNNFDSQPSVDPVFKPTKQYFIKDVEFGRKLMNSKGKQINNKIVRPIASKEADEALYTRQSLSRPAYSKNLVSVPEVNYQEPTLTRQYSRDMTGSDSNSIQLYPISQQEEPALSRQYQLKKTYINTDPNDYKLTRQYILTADDALDEKLQPIDSQLDRAYARFVNNLNRPESPEQLSRQYLIKEEISPYGDDESSVDEQNAILQPQQRVQYVLKNPTSLRGQYKLNRVGVSPTTNNRLFKVLLSNKQFSRRSENQDNSSTNTEKSATTLLSNDLSHNSTLVSFSPTPVPQMLIKKRDSTVKTESIGKSKQMKSASFKTDGAILKPPAGNAKVPKKRLILHAYIDNNNKLVISDGFTTKMKEISTN